MQGIHSAQSHQISHHCEAETDGTRSSTWPHMLEETTQT